MLVELGAGDRGADAKAAVLGGDLVHLGNALHVDHELGLDHPGAQLHEQVGAAGQDARVAARPRQQRDCRLKCLRSLVTHVLGASPLLARALPSRSSAPGQTTLRSAKVNGTRRRTAGSPLGASNERLRWPNSWRPLGIRYMSRFGPI